MHHMINEITLENYRCFHTKQVAPMAPLTLLVGENSTGKTSFLAMIRVLWDCIYGLGMPDFNEEPFQLGSFDEIAHRQNERSEPASTFEAKARVDHDWEADFVFGEMEDFPMLRKTRFTNIGEDWIEQYYDNENCLRMHVGTSRGEWEVPKSINNQDTVLSLNTLGRMLPFIFPNLYFSDRKVPHEEFSPLYGAPQFEELDVNSIKKFRCRDKPHQNQRPSASAPVRSKPKRTYDPIPRFRDPEGSHVPMLLARLASKDKRTWSVLKNELERFGKAAGIFNEINVNRLEESGNAPFQIQVRRFDEKRNRKGIKQDLTDVGYGISQILPILTELLLPENTHMLLLQQPEVHLHPKAQATLGTLLCEVAAQGRQLVVETHGDHLINRIRMDVRDGKIGLNPEDVSILFFEQKGLNVQIHAIRIDKLGNVLDAPASYGRFFMEETARSLGI